jgi:hydroxymethylbilane synthase
MPIYAKGLSLSTKQDPMSKPILRIVSRGSPLALAQSHLVRAALAAAHGWTGDLDRLCPIITMKTAGDRIQDRPLVEAGGKGLFVKEIEEALIANEGDVAVHSMKDMPAVQPSGLTITAVLPREDPRDVFIGRDGVAFGKLPMGARLGTSSVRRQAQALRQRPDLEIVPLRGNVETRLAKLKRGEADATMLARAGLSRLNIVLPESHVLEEFLPALCQGAVGLEIRETDTRTRALVDKIDHGPTHLAVSCERGFLAALDGSCRTPIAGLARIDGSALEFTGEALTVNGRDSWQVERGGVTLPSSAEAARARAHEIGQESGREVRDSAGDYLPRH